MVKFYTYLEVFLNDMTKSVSLSEFQGHFKIPHQTIKKHLQKLIEQKILSEEKRERFLFFRLNLNNPLTREYLIMCEKERLMHFLEKNTLFARLYEEMSEFFFDSKFLIFGSATEKKDFADIDLLIISRNKKILSTVKRFKETYSVKIHALLTTKDDLTKTFIQEIRKKHIIFNSHEHFMEVLYNEH